MFNEKKSEYSNKQGKDIPVWQNPKYIESRNKAIEIIEGKKYGIAEADFWILMNETKSGKMAYTGLIISHNGCLKINDALPAKDKFKPECVSLDKEGYNGSLVYSYCCPEQGVYEVGEVNPKNCKIEYPYAMAFKRMMDRVVLKNSKLAYSGIYSEVEADEFKHEDDVPDETLTDPAAPTPKKTSQKKEQPLKEDEPPKQEDPEDYPPVLRDPPQEEPKYYCRDCGEPLVWTRTKGGEDMSPTDIQNLSYKRYGRVLCPRCMKAAEAKKESA